MAGAPSPGSQIGRFQLEAEVGRGAMGVVYRVRDEALNRPVALKLLAAHLDSDKSTLLRFHREASAVANLKHPNIAIVYEFGEQAGQPFIALEWVEGGTLRNLLNSEGRLPPERAQKIFDQVASALDYAHQRNVIHRDIKPANIMIGPDDHATIVDFGLASLAAAPTITATGSIFGTPRYMSPEQIKGEPVDGRTDLYSLAVMMYEMLAGQPPFDSAAIPALLHHHLYTPPPPITEFNPALSPATESALTKALAKSPAERFQSGAEFSAALRGASAAAKTDPALAAQQTVIAARASQTEAAKPVAPRRRWLIGSLALIGLCSLAALIAGGLSFQGWVVASATRTASFEETSVAQITAPVENTETATPEFTEPPPEETPTEFPTPIPTPTLITPIAYSPPFDGGLWTMTGGEPARTNFVYEGLGQLSPGARWSRFPQSGGNTGAVVAGGMVVFGLDGGKVRALNWTTGLTAWETWLGEGVELTGDPAIFISEEGAAVFVSTSTGELAALSLWDGSEIWRKSAEELGGVVYGGVTVGGDGTVYALADSGKFCAVNPFSGEVYWSVDLTEVDYFVLPPAITGSGIYLPGGNQFLYALNPEGLEPIWTGEIVGSPSTSPMVAESMGLVIIGTEGGWVHAFWFDGTPAWSAQASNKIAGLATDNNRVYATISDGTAYAWDVASGEQVWAVNTGGELTAAPLTDGNTVVIATHEGELRYFNATDGVEYVDLKISLGDGIWFAPAPAGGWLFVRAWNVYGVGP